MKIEDLNLILDKMEFNDGVDAATKEISERGIKTALLSNIPTHLGNLVKKKLGLDYVSGTVLEERDGRFTGKVLEFNNDKAKAAMNILNTADISSREAISVGDGVDDTKVFELVQFGISFRGKPEVRDKARYHIESFSKLLPIINKENQ